MRPKKKLILRPQDSVIVENRAFCTVGAAEYDLPGHPKGFSAKRSGEAFWKC